MSVRQLAERAGLSKTSVASAEASEARGTVQLNSIQRLAEAMDCRLVYAIVPNDSLRHAIEEQAERRAARLVAQVSDSMELEEQGVSREEKRRQVRDLADEVLRSRGRDFWDV
jgi:predicted DNA-binding mobile mystery protein A